MHLLTLPVKRFKAGRKERVDVRLVNVRPPATQLRLNRVHAGRARPLAAGRVAGAIVPVTTAASAAPAADGCFLEGLTQQ